jgi:ribokinase
MRPARPTVLVVGSLNIDYIASVAQLPSTGQTVAASALIRRFGGKGANQAIAAARQGARVRMVGCLGADDEGRAYRKRLKSEGIDRSGILQTKKALTGTALIAVDKRGENIIVVAPGANALFSPKQLVTKILLTPVPDAILLQFEISMKAITQVIKMAMESGVPVMLNPSPLREGFPWGKCVVDTLIVNEGEAEAIFKRSPKSIEQQLPPWRKSLEAHKIQHLVITRGARATLCLTGTKFLKVPTLKISPIDTVGAGDAFAGTYAARRAEGLDLLASIRLANCAGALTTLEAGAQEAIPRKLQTERALKRLR